MPNILHDIEKLLKQAAEGEPSLQPELFRNTAPGAIQLGPKPPATAARRPTGLGRGLWNGTTGLLGGLAAGVGSLAGRVATPLAYAGERAGILPQHTGAGARAAQQYLRQGSDAGLNQALHNRTSTAFNDWFDKGNKDLARTEPDQAGISRDLMSAVKVPQALALVGGTGNLAPSAPGFLPAGVQTGLRALGKAQKWVGNTSTAMTAADAGTKAVQAATAIPEKINSQFASMAPAVPAGAPGTKVLPGRVQASTYTPDALSLAGNVAKQWVPQLADKDPLSRTVGDTARDGLMQTLRHSYYRQPGLFGSPTKSSWGWAQPVQDAAAALSFNPTAIGSRLAANAIGQEKPPDYGQIAMQHAQKNWADFEKDPKSVLKSPFISDAQNLGKRFGSEVAVPWVQQLGPMAMGLVGSNAQRGVSLMQQIAPLLASVGKFGPGRAGQPEKVRRP